MSRDSQMALREKTDMDATLRWHDGKVMGRRSTFMDRVR